MSRAKLDRRAVERFDELVERLKEVRRTVDGRDGDSQFDRPELHPGYLQLQHHVDHALRWAEEMLWIIDNELAAPGVMAERAAS